MTVQMVGNAAILDLPKTAFLSSRKISPEATLKCREWAGKMRDGGRCVITGAQSELEKEVFSILLAGSQPLILVLARALWAEVPLYLQKAIGSGRLLAISPIKGFSTRVSKETALARNRYILQEAEEAVFGSLDPARSLAGLLRNFTGKPYSILEGA